MSRFYWLPKHSTAQPLPNLHILEIAYLFKINPKTVREEWEDVDIFEMLALHSAKQMARAQIAKHNKMDLSSVEVPAFCPVRKNGD